MQNRNFRWSGLYLVDIFGTEMMQEIDAGRNIR